MVKMFSFLRYQKKSDVVSIYMSSKKGLILCLF